MNMNTPALPTRQRGMATLLVALILLIAITLIVITTARTAFMEQRMSGNDMRTKAAFEAAQAGLDFAVSYFNTPGGMDKDSPPDGVIDTLTANPVALTDQSGARIVGYYQVVFCSETLDLNAADCDTLDFTNCSGTPPANPLATLILACGWSDDNVGQRRIVQVLRKSPAMSNPPTNPLSARGGVNVGGSATVTNYFNNLTIWSGQSIDNIGNSGKTYVRNPDVPTPVADAAIPLPPSPTTCTSNDDYICTTDINTVGPDVIASDTSIAYLTDEQFFVNYFGETPAEYRETYASMEVAGNDTSSLDGTQNEVIWVEGDASFQGGTQIGDRDNPVIVIINGDASAAGTVTIYGVVYVMGDISGAGNFEVQGSMIVNGLVSGTGSVDVTFDPVTVGKAGTQLAKAGSLAGSWRDW